MDEITQVKTKFRLEQWTKLIQECQSSDLPVRTWCKQNGCNEQSYYYWLKKIRKQICKELPSVKQEEEKPVVFKQLQVQSSIPNTQAAVIIHLPSTKVEVLEGTSQQTVEAVLLALRNIC